MNPNVLKSTFWFTVKVLAMLVLIVIFSTPATFAQRMSAEERAERMKAQIDEVVKALALSEEKEVQVRGILEEEAEERASIFQGFQGQDSNARQAMREEMAALTENTNKKLASVLSEDEMKKYNEVQAKIQEQRRAQFGGRRGGGQPPVN